MPLPEGLPGGTSVPWPPKVMEPAVGTVEAWSAWYSGDPDQLERIYEHRARNVTSTGLAVRPSQHSGGLRGWFARWFWGAPPANGEPRTKLHIPLAADIAQVSSELLFSEPISIKHPNAATQKKLTELLDDTMHTQLLEGAEVAAGLGGVYLRVVWDKDRNDSGPWVSAMHTDAAVPEWTYGRLNAVTFWRILEQKNDVVYRWLERHDVGVISHAVYKGTPEKLGMSVPLDLFPETAPFAQIVVDGTDIPTGIDRLTAVYWPNVKPNRMWRSYPVCCHLGRSDFAGVEGIFDALDEVWSSLMRDIQLGKGKVFVPSTYLESNRPGEGAQYDPERTFYEQLNILPEGGQGSQITVAQFEIRIDEHLRAAEELIKKAIDTAGYSEQSFGLAGDVAITATEVAARYRRSLSTRAKKMLYTRPPIAEILQVLADVGKVHFAWPTDGTVPPEVIFADAVQVDPETTARTIQLLDAARAASTETKVMLANPQHRDDPEWIQKEVDKIKEENGIGVQLTDPAGFTGAPPAAAKKSDDKPTEDQPPARKDDTS